MALCVLGANIEFLGHSCEGGCWLCVNILVKWCRSETEGKIQVLRPYLDENLHLKKGESSYKQLLCKCFYVEKCFYITLFLKYKILHSFLKYEI